MVFTVITLHVTFFCLFLASDYDRNGEFIEISTSGVGTDFDKFLGTKSKAHPGDPQAATAQTVARVSPDESLAGPTGIPVVPVVPQNVVGSLDDRETVPVRQHAVAKGETFTSIGKSYDLPAFRIAEANPGVDPRRLRIGQSLAIPQQPAEFSTSSNSSTRESRSPILSQGSRIRRKS